MKKVILAFSVLNLLNVSAFAQQSLYEIEGFKIEAIVQKLEPGDKKDKYLLQIKTKATDHDWYYPASMSVNSRTKKPFITNKNIGSVKVQNATGLFNTETIDGEISKFRTEDGSILMVFKKDKVYSEEQKFKVPSGVEPIITFTENKSLKRLEEYNLMVDGNILNGTWTSDCIQGTTRLNYSDTGSTEFVILQNANNQSRWNRRSSQVFQKSDASATITYDKATNTLIYFNNDGIRCAMKREE